MFPFLPLCIVLIFSSVISFLSSADGTLSGANRAASLTTAFLIVVTAWVAALLLDDVDVFDTITFLTFIYVFMMETSGSGHEVAALLFGMTVGFALLSFTFSYLSPPYAAIQLVFPPLYLAFHSGRWNVNRAAFRYVTWFALLEYATVAVVVFILLSVR